MQEARSEEVEVLLRRFKVGENVGVLLRVLETVQCQLRVLGGSITGQPAHDLRLRPRETVKVSVCGDFEVWGPAQSYTIVIEGH